MLTLEAWPAEAPTEAKVRLDLSTAWKNGMFPAQQQIQWYTTQALGQARHEEQRPLAPAESTGQLEISVQPNVARQRVVTPSPTCLPNTWRYSSESPSTHTTGPASSHANA